MNGRTPGVLDAGVLIGWIRRTHRSLKRIDGLIRGCEAGSCDLSLSTVNLAEVLIHTRKAAAALGADPVALLRGSGIRLHLPDEAVARRVAILPTSLADGFAAATAQLLGARLHTTDGDLARHARRLSIPVTLY